MKDIFYFQSNGKWLFSVLTGKARQSLRTGVVICHPYAEEKQRTDRLAVKISNDLAAIDIPVLRFDYVGYGDSEGEFEDSTINSQIEDIGMAIDAMCQRADVDSVYLMGVRFGGTLAALRAEMDERVAGLVLWSPVTDGKLYLDSLFRNKIFSTFTDSSPRVTREELETRLRSEGRLDVDGYYLTTKMAEEMESVTLLDESSRFKGNLFLAYNGKHDKNIDQLVGKYTKTGAAVTLFEAGERIYWDMRSHYEWYFPTEIIEESEQWFGTFLGGH